VRSVAPSPTWLTQGAAVGVLERGWPPYNAIVGTVLPSGMVRVYSVGLIREVETRCLSPLVPLGRLGDREQDAVDHVRLTHAARLLEKKEFPRAAAEVREVAARFAWAVQRKAVEEGT
jgi:hypothetical protein